MLIVQKFGGSSLADISGLRRAAEIILSAVEKGYKVAAVVSAMGDCTDELSELAHRISPRPPERELDALLGTGEMQSAALLSIMLNHLGHNALSFSAAQAGIYTTDRHGDAEIRNIKPGRISSALTSGCIAVIAGFQGIGPDGSLTTLGRGGSDTSAVALAAALGAERCEIYKDVDGIYTADPMLAGDARLLSQIDFQDMHTLSLCGSQVLHSRSVFTAMTEGLPMLVLNSFKKGEGTKVCPLSMEERPDFAGITRNKAENSMSLVGKAADEQNLGRLCRLLSNHGIDILSARLDEGCITLHLPADKLKKALQLAHTEFLA